MESQDARSAYIAAIRDVYLGMPPQAEAQNIFSLSQSILGKVADIPQVWLEYGRSLLNLGYVEQARTCFQQAGVVGAAAWFVELGKGLCLLAADGVHYQSSTDDINRVNFWDITSGINHVVVIVYNVAISLTYSGYHQQAEICFRSVLGLMNDSAGTKHAIAECLLQQHQYQAAAQLMPEWLNPIVEKLHLGTWRGEDLTDKTLFVLGDNGLGDIVFSLRYLHQLAPRCGKIILYLDARLHWLVGPIPNVEITDSLTIGGHYFTSLYVLPYVMGIMEYAQATPIPYIVSDSDHIRRWRDRLPQNGFKVGILWQGEPVPPWRSMPLAALAPLSDIPGVTLISLQKFGGTEQLATKPAGMQVVELGDDFDTDPRRFYDTVAVMHSLDLIISIDTSIAHLAGALGRPVWVLLKAVPDWRWFGGEGESVWYPSMRLYRQPRHFDWDGAVALVRQDLMRLVNPS